MAAPAPVRTRVARPGPSSAATARRLEPAPQRRPEQPQPRPRLRVVDDARHKAAARRRRMRLVMVAAGVVTAGCLFALAAFNAVLVTGQGRLDSLEQQVAEAQSAYSASRLQVAELEAPHRIVQVAQTRLGMVPPQELTYLSPSVAMAEQAGTRAATGVATGEGGAAYASVKPYLDSRP